VRLIVENGTSRCDFSKTKSKVAATTLLCPLADKKKDRGPGLYLSLPDAAKSHVVQPAQ